VSAHSQFFPGRWPTFVQPSRNDKPQDGLDRFALAVIGVAACFIALALRSPFSVGVVAGAAVMAVYGWWMKDARLVVIASFLPGFTLLAWLANYWVYQLTPHTIDGQLSRLDLGSAAAIWKWCESEPLVHSALSLAYYALGVAAGIAIAVSKRRAELLKACVIAPILGIPLYLLFPAVGPRWIGQAAARNCFPSMHVAWAAFFWMYTSDKWKLAMAGVLAVTVAATIGLGEHYFVDLVAAIPFVWAVSKLAAVKPATEGGVQ
jgi:hypothetical protein